MSKFVTLLQQLEREPVGLYPDSTPVSPSDDDRNNGHRQKQKTPEEALRLVQQLFLYPAEAPRVVVFAGINHRHGCSHVSAEVAKTLAKNTLQSVCLVEANFRSPSLSRFFGVTGNRGFSDAILREGSVKSFAKLVSEANLWLLSSGAPIEDVETIIASDHLRHRMSELRDEFDFVLIDAPPVTRYPDASILGQISDGLVLILDAESTRRETTEAVAGNLRSVNVPILAAILNSHTSPLA